MVQRSESVAPAIALAAALALTSLAAQAAEAASPPPRSSSDQWPGYEVAVLGGVTLGGSFDVQQGAGAGAPAGGGSQHADLEDRGSFAVALDLRADEMARYELFYGRESTLLRGAAFGAAPLVVEYLHLGGLVVLDDQVPLEPYLAGGLGITRLSPQAPANSDTRFSGSLGVGLRWPLDRHFSLRLEARGLLTLVSSDSSIFCRSDQSGLLCRIQGRGQTFFQGQMLAGVAFVF